MNLGRAIVTIRAWKGIKQSELGEKAGISVPYISLLEQNKRNPSFSTVVRIADALGISMVQLMYLATNDLIEPESEGDES